jgi:2'-5' RNA ligase
VPPDAELVLDTLIAAAQAGEQTGAMVALLPTVEWCEKYAMDDGLPPDELHVTLAYIGDAAGIGEEQRAAIQTTCQNLAGELGQVEGEGFSVALFNPLGDEPCVVLGLSGAALANCQRKITTALEVARVDLGEQHQPWIPHITLAYTDDQYAVADVTDRCGPVTFDRLRVAFAGENSDYPLGAADTVTEPPPVEEAAMVDCPPGQHPMPDGTCMDDEAMPQDGETFHLPGKHNQKDHGYGRGGRGGKITVLPGFKPNPKYPVRMPKARSSTDEAAVVRFAVGDRIDYEGDPEGVELLDEFDPTLTEGSSGTPWWTVAVPEGEWSNDVQMAPGALEWAGLLPEPLLWQPMTGPEHDGSVIVGRIDGTMRIGPKVYSWGVFDDAGEYGSEALRLAEGGFLQGVSISGDNIEPHEIEYVCPVSMLSPDMAIEDSNVETMHLPGRHNQKDHSRYLHHEGKRVTVIRHSADMADDGMPETMRGMISEAVCESPKKIIHRARLRSLTLVAEPNFPDARLRIGPPPPELGLTMVAAAVGPHDTGTTDEPWDGPAAEKNLPSPMPVAKARAVYAWVDDAQVDAGELPKTAGRFIHHTVSADGTPGAANLTACSTGIGVLNGGRGGTTVPAEDVQGIYDHLAAHLRDGDREPPPLTASMGPRVVVAAGYTITIPDLPPEAWFNPPEQAPPIGALHITDEGQVYGYLAPSGVNHRAFRASGQQVQAPRRIDYSEFMNKTALVSDAHGDAHRINAGNITFDCGHMHALDPRRVDPNAALEHYDNSCSVAARIRVGEDQHGTWVAGALLSSVDADTVERMMACALSGDWQDGRLNAALLVPVEGFPRAVPGNVRIRDGAVVASSAPVVFTAATKPRESDLRPALERVARSIRRDHGSRMAALRTRVDAARGAH